MKNKLPKSILASLIAMALGACENTTPQPIDEPIDQMGIVVGVDQQTEVNQTSQSKVTVDKVAKTTVFNNNDKIGLYLVEWGMDNAAETGLLAAGNQTDNHTYTYNGTAWTSSTLTNPLTWRKVSAYAYHPWQATVANALAFPFTVDDDQSSGIESKDYLMRGVGTANATGYTPAKGGNIALKFQHKLVRLVVKVNLPSTYNGTTISGFTTVSSVACPVSTTLNTYTGVATPSIKLGEVKMARTDDASDALVGVYEAMVVPRNIPANELILRVGYETSTNVKDSLLFYAPTGGVNLAENSIHTITLTTSELGFLNELAPLLTAGETKTINVVANPSIAWTVTVDSKCDWLTVSADNATYGQTITKTSTGQQIYIKAAANDTGLPRMTGLKLIGGTFPERQLTVTQL